MAAGGPVRRLYGVLRVTRRRVREAAPYKGGRCLDGGGGKPRPTWVAPLGRTAQCAAPTVCKNDSTDS